MVLAVLSVMPFMVCLFWCVIFLIEYRSLTGAQRVLLSFFGVSTALYFCHGMFFIGHGEQVIVSDIVYSFCNIAVFPIFYLYIRRLTVTGKLPWKCYLDLLPAVVICLWTAIIYTIGGQDVLQRQELRVTTGKIVFVVQLLLVSYFGARRLRLFDKAIEEFYSNKENRELSLFGFMTFLMLACALVSTIASSVGREYFSQNEAILALPSCTFSAVLFTIAYVGHKQRFDADALEEDIREAEEIDFAPPYSLSVSQPVTQPVIESGETDSRGRTTPTNTIHTESETTESETDSEREAENRIQDLGQDNLELQASSDIAEMIELLEDSSLLRERLMELIEKDHIYLNSNLKLTDVASSLHIGRSTLSAFINQHLGVSFSDFINAKRIDHAKGLIKTEPTLSLIEVSEKSGFASPSSFYRAFKKYVGVTPKDWMAKGNQ